MKIIKGGQILTSDGLNAEVIASENIRKQNELDRIANEATRANVVEAIETQYAPRLTGVESQLAEIVTNVNKYFMVGEVDHTEAIRRAYTATPDFGTLFLPSGWYQYSDTLTFNRPVHLKFDGNLEYTGTRDKTTILVNLLTNININFSIIKDASPSRVNLTDGWHGWVNDNYIGVVLRNLKNCDISIKHVINFNVGVRCMAEGGGGFWFNRVKINALTNNRIQLDLCSKDVGSWMNSNYWLDTAFVYAENVIFSTAVFDRILINQSLLNGNVYGGNTGSFANFKFENHANYGGTYTAIKLYRAHGFKFVNYRNELLSAGTVFCTLDVGGTLAGDLYYCIDNTIFEPLYVVGGAATSVILLNTELGKNPYSIIYQFLPSPSRYLLFDEQDLNKRYRFLTSNRHTIKNILRKSLTSTDLNETMTDYYAGDGATPNGAYITPSYPIVLYVNNLVKGDEISVEVESSNVAQVPSIRIKAWDKSNVFCADGLIETAKAVAHYGTWDITNKAYKPNINSNQERFTINHANVGTVAILVYGFVRSLKIYTSNRNNMTKKTNITKIDRIDGFMSDVVPVNKTDGYFKPDDVVYYYDGTNVTQYKLVYNTGVLTWVSQGQINM